MQDERQGDRREFLDGNHVRYVVLSHSPGYTAAEVAESMHIPRKSLAKVVIVAVGGRFAMAVVPATQDDVDMTRLQEETGVNDVRLADEAEFARRFEGCKIGTVPPFGNLFGVDTYVDRSVAAARYIAFNAGTHTDVIVMDFEDYQRLARPKLVRIGMKAVEIKLHVAQL